MKKLWLKVQAFIITVFGGAKKFEKFLVDHADEAIEVVTKIKRAVENPVIITLVGLLPEKYKTVAGEALAKADIVINKVLDKMVLANSCLQQPTTALRLKCFIEHLKQFPPDVQQAMYLKFASLYATYSSGSEESRSRIDTAVQMRFLEKKENLV